MTTPTLDSDRLETAPTALETPEATFGIVGLRSGRAHLVASRRSTRSGAEVEEGTRSGLIFTDRQDMPSLEQLLEENKVAYAVLERPVPTPEQPLRVAVEEPVASGVLFRNYLRVAAGAAFAASVSAAGSIVLVDAIAEDALHANPYTALSLALGGLGLLATLLVAVKGRAK
jgi:hypothetical protein